jgi:hypothetical protein
MKTEERREYISTLQLLLADLSPKDKCEVVSSAFHGVFHTWLPGGVKGRRVHGHLHAAAGIVDNALAHADGSSGLGMKAVEGLRSILKVIKNELAAADARLTDMGIVDPDKEKKK